MNAFRYLLKNATLYRWEQYKNDGDWIRCAPFTLIEIAWAHGVYVDDISITETDDGTVFEYVPF